MNETARRRLIAVLSLLFLIAALVALTFLFGDTLTDMVKDPESFRRRTDGRGWLGKLIFVALNATQVILAVLPGQIFAIAGGYCFGIPGGILLTLFGTLIGSSIAFLLARIFGLSVVTAFYSREKLQNLFFLKESKSQDFLTFLLFLIPGIPKDMLTYFMGLTKMRFPKFLLLSIFGRLPALTLTVLGGAAVQSKNVTLCIVAACVVAALSLLSFLLYQYKKQKEKT